MEQSPPQESWAEGLTVCITGLSKAERHLVKTSVIAAGGRYSPNLSRRCTHLLVASDPTRVSSQKLSLALHNRQRWQTTIVDTSWLSASREQGWALPGDLFPPCCTTSHQQSSTAEASPLREMQPLGTARLKGSNSRPPPTPIVPVIKRERSGSPLRNVTVRAQRRPKRSRLQATTFAGSADLASAHPDSTSPSHHQQGSSPASAKPDQPRQHQPVSSRPVPDAQPPAAAAVPSCQLPELQCSASPGAQPSSGVAALQQHQQQLQRTWGLSRSTGALPHAAANIAPVPARSYPAWQLPAAPVAAATGSTAGNAAAQHTCGWMTHTAQPAARSSREPLSRSADWSLQGGSKAQPPACSEATLAVRPLQPRPVLKAAPGAPSASTDGASCWLAMPQPLGSTQTAALAARLGDTAASGTTAQSHDTSKTSAPGPSTAEARRAAHVASISGASPLATPGGDFDQQPAAGVPQADLVGQLCALRDAKRPPQRDNPSSIALRPPSAIANAGISAAATTLTPSEPHNPSSWADPVPLQELAAQLQATRRVPRPALPSRTSTELPGAASSSGQLTNTAAPDLQAGPGVSALPPVEQSAALPPQPAAFEAAELIAQLQAIKASRAHNAAKAPPQNAATTSRQVSGGAPAQTVSSTAHPGPVTSAQALQDKPAAVLHRVADWVARTTLLQPHPPGPQPAPSDTGQRSGHHQLRSAATASSLGRSSSPLQPLQLATPIMPHAAAGVDDCDIIPDSEAGTPAPQAGPDWQQSTQAPEPQLLCQAASSNGPVAGVEPTAQPPHECPGVCGSPDALTPPVASSSPVLPCTLQRHKACEAEASVTEELPGPLGFTPTSEAALADDASCSRTVTLTAPSPQLAAPPQQHSVFAGIKAIIDPALSAQEADRVRAALAAGGGQEACGAYLGTGASHVVCHPESAVRWLAMGLSIVSPQWVVRSGETGAQQRCLVMSLDASRHLPSAAEPASGAGADRAAAALPSTSFACQSSTADVAVRKSAEAGWQGLLSNRAAREQLVASLAVKESSAGAGRHCAVHQPATLLEGVVWAVTEPPERAYLEADHSLHHTKGGGRVVVMGAPGAEDLCLLMSTSQQAAADVCGAGLPEPAAGRAQLTLAARDETVYRGASMTLLLPQDARGELGHCSRTMSVPPAGLTRWQLLTHIHAFYQEALGVEEQLQLLQGRSAQLAQTVKAAFLELQALPRGALLQSRCSLEGLTRVSRDPRSTIYELRLSC